MYDGVPPGATVLTGVGRVSGRSCMIIVKRRHGEGRHDVRHDHQAAYACSKLFAWQHRLPCITMVQSGGGSAHLANIFPDEGHAGSIMYNQVKMSSEGIPQIAIVHGPFHGWWR